MVCFVAVKPVGSGTKERYNVPSLTAVTCCGSTGSEGAVELRELSPGEIKEREWGKMLVCTQCHQVQIQYILYYSSGGLQCFLATWKPGSVSWLTVGLPIPQTASLQGCLQADLQLVLLSTPPSFLSERRSLKRETKQVNKRTPDKLKLSQHWCRFLHA